MPGRFASKVTPTGPAAAFLGPVAADIGPEEGGDERCCERSKRDVITHVGCLLTPTVDG